MTSKRETVLSTFWGLLQAQFTDCKLQRNGILPTTIPAGGLIVFRDGDPGEPEVTLGPLTYIYEHQAVCEVLVENEAEQDALLDSLLQRIGAIIEADRFLQTLCDWVEAKAPDPVDLATEGGEPVKATAVIIVLVYGSPSPI